MFMGNRTKKNTDMDKTKATYVNEYVRQHYDRMILLLPQGTKIQLKNVAAANGVSVNAFVNELISNQLIEN